MSSGSSSVVDNSEFCPENKNCAQNLQLMAHYGPYFSKPRRIFFRHTGAPLSLRELVTASDATSEPAMRLCGR